MIALEMQVEEQVVAKMLWQVKAIATKEYESLPLTSKQNMFRNDTPFETSQDSYEAVPDRRKRTVSIESFDRSLSPYSSPIIAPRIITLIDDNSRFSDSSVADSMEHHDWSKRVPFLLDESDAASLSPSPSPGLRSTELITQKYGKRKRENFVGLTTKGGRAVRATLRKKFSWKQYPELEGFLVDNQDDYFEFSSRNYTAEQRKYNNSLTRGLLELAAEQGYIFEDFTFSMVRDRIRCYYKSHSQSAKKKRRR